jgi:hypothetical protein
MRNIRYIWHPAMPSNSQRPFLGPKGEHPAVAKKCKVKGGYHTQNLKMVILEPVAMFLHWRVFRF